MDTPQYVVIDLEELARRMAQAIPELDCPDCCGPVYEFIEVGARFYQEESEWAVFASALVCARRNRRSPSSKA